MRAQADFTPLPRAVHRRREEAQGFIDFAHDARLVSRLRFVSVLLDLGLIIGVTCLLL